jgi:hypothetical protein
MIKKSLLLRVLANSIEQNARASHLPFRRYDTMRNSFPIIEKLGGREAVTALLIHLGLVKNESAVRMWSSPLRGVIPGDAARELMKAADNQNIPYQADDFVPCRTETPSGATSFVYRDWGTSQQG